MCKGLFKKMHGESLKKAVRVLVKDCPACFPAAIALAVLRAVQPYIGLLLSSEILNGLAGPQPQMKRLAVLAVLLVAFNFLAQQLCGFLGQFYDVLKYREMKQAVDGRIALKAWGMDYAMLSDPEINSRRMRIALNLFEHGIVQLMEEFQAFLSSIITIGISLVLAVEFFSARAVSGGKLAAFLNHWQAPLIFLGLFAFSSWFTLWAAARRERLLYRREEDSQDDINQLYGVADACCAQYKNGKDLRIFGGSGLAFGRLKEITDRVIPRYEAFTAATRPFEAADTLIGRGFDLLIYLFVGLKAVCGAFGPGSILRYTGMVAQLGRGITGLFDVIRAFLQNGAYLDDYFAYLELPNRTAEGTKPVTDEIKNGYCFEFQNVTFTYPGAAAPSLSRISCSFRKGEKIAVVGRNGSGKSTWIKLLCRLYDPQEGRILLNGTDIREYNYEDYLRFFSTVFQDYQLFSFKLGENVAATGDYSEDRVKTALEQAGFGQRLREFKDGLDTLLFQYYSEDGVELSGGESQKVAIARCLYKDAPCVILDEPTSALDAVAEADIYRRMDRFTSGKGAVYISHRLSSCRFCDRVFVFDEGRLAEEGTHEALLERKGLYAKLWHAQAQYYQA